MSDEIQPALAKILGKSQQERIAELEAQLAECRQVLKEVEWAEGRDHGRSGSCTLCARDEDAGHAPDCRLAKALGP